MQCSLICFKKNEQAVCGYERSVNLELRGLGFESWLSKWGHVKSQQISSQQALLPAGNPRCCGSDSSTVIIPGIRFPHDCCLQMVRDYTLCCGSAPLCWWALWAGGQWAVLWGLQLLPLPFPSWPEPCSHRWLLTHSWKPQWLCGRDCGCCKAGKGICHPLSPAGTGSREGYELHSGEATAAPLTSLAPAVAFPWGKQSWWGAAHRRTACAFFCRCRQRWGRWHRQAACPLVPERSLVSTLMSGSPDQIQEE